MGETRSLRRMCSVLIKEESNSTVLSPRRSLFTDFYCVVLWQVRVDLKTKKGLRTRLPITFIMHTCPETRVSDYQRIRPYVSLQGAIVSDFLGPVKPFIVQNWEKDVR